ncbi:hypothetical protein, partial [Agrobacterium pusense]|uniref:hypothetical protein n=1 Tax=Agrobacterium pusense TaxID=648995 RepID=UPI001AECBDB1
VHARKQRHSIPPSVNRRALKTALTKKVGPKTMEGTAVTLIRVIIMPAGASACFAISCSTSLGH